MWSMSESAANVNPFFVEPLQIFARPGTLPTAGAEDKPLLGSKPSADSGARPGWGSKLEPQRFSSKLGWHERAKSQGPGDRVPREHFSFR
jgi:hypothetical protein